jgi:hypothetical protein
MSTVRSHAMVKSFGQSIAISATQLYDRPLITSAVGITGENAKGIMIGQCLMCVSKYVQGPAATSPGLGLQKWGLMKLFDKQGPSHFAKNKGRGAAEGTPQPQ